MFNFFKKQPQVIDMGSFSDMVNSHDIDVVNERGESLGTIAKHVSRRFHDGEIIYDVAYELTGLVSLIDSDSLSGVRTRFDGKTIRILKDNIEPNSLLYQLPVVYHVVTKGSTTTVNDVYDTVPITLSETANALRFVFQPNEIIQNVFEQRDMSELEKDAIVIDHADIGHNTDNQLEVDVTVNAIQTTPVFVNINGAMQRHEASVELELDESRDGLHLKVATIPLNKWRHAFTDGWEIPSHYRVANVGQRHDMTPSELDAESRLTKKFITSHEDQNDPIMIELAIDESVFDPTVVQTLHGVIDYLDEHRFEIISTAHDSMNIDTQKLVQGYLGTLVEEPAESPREMTTEDLSKSMVDAVLSDNDEDVKDSDKSTRGDSRIVQESGTPETVGYQYTVEYQDGSQTVYRIVEANDVGDGIKNFVYHKDEFTPEEVAEAKKLASDTSDEESDVVDEAPEDAGVETNNNAASDELSEDVEEENESEMEKHDGNVD